MYSRKESAGYRVSLLSRLYIPFVNKHMVSMGITVGQIPFVLEVLRHNGITQDGLSELVEVDKAATARSLMALENQGLVIRRENPENRRQKNVLPTKKLKKMESAIIKIVKEVNNKLLDGFDSSERKKVLGILDQLIVNCRGCNNDKEV